jgi:hypothetical protein
MELIVLAVPGCPNVAVLEQRLGEALAERPAITVTRRVIADAGEAARWGMTGSPTLLINGRDPFAVPGASPAMACRLYRNADGTLDYAPTAEALRQALKQAGALS